MQMFMSLKCEPTIQILEPEQVAPPAVESLPHFPYLLKLMGHLSKRRFRFSLRRSTLDFCIGGLRLLLPDYSPAQT